MRQINRLWVGGLEGFGLTKRRLRDLGARPVTLEISIPVSPYVYPSAALFHRLRKQSPQDRRNLVRQWRVDKHRQLICELPFENYEVIRFNSAPVGVRLTIPAQSVHKLFNLRHAESIRIQAIKGLKIKNTSKSPRLFAVKARLVFQLEGQTKGLQHCEERIFLISAKSEEDAKRRATRKFRQEESPSLTVSGHCYRWHFEKIIDVCEPIEESFNPAGTEVYYNYRNRRLRPEYEWHPKRESNKDHALGVKRKKRK